MDGLTYKTWRAHRSIIERLQGHDKIYETKVTDGDRTAYGRGATRRESLLEAERHWLEQFADPDPLSGA
jgi:hypothetical protein